MPLQVGTSHHVTWTRNGLTNVIYIDGVDYTAIISGATTISGTTYLGCSNALYSELEGMLDEFRFEKVVRSPDWVDAQWRSQRINGCVQVAICAFRV